MEKKHFLYICSLLALSLLLAACGADGGSATPGVPGPKTLSGTAVDWNEQATSVRADGYVKRLDAEGSYIQLAEGTVGPDGNFSLTLPGPAGVDSALYAVESANLCNLYTENDNAMGTVTVTPSPLNIAEVGALAVYPSPESDEFLGVISYEGGNARVGQIYSSIDARIEGRCTSVDNDSVSSGGSVPETSVTVFDLNLNAGWNDVVSTSADLSGGGTTTSVTTGSIPDEVTWRYFDFTPSSIMRTYQPTKN